MTYFFYILRCSDNTLYCGQTNNLQKRITEHNSNGTKSAKYLRARKPVKLVYFEKYLTLQETMKREWQVKKWTKVKKEALIYGNLKLLKNYNPERIYTERSRSSRRTQKF